MDEKFIRKISIDWKGIGENSYLRGIPAIKSINELALDRNITFFVGENGTGKSTLLEAIAVSYGFNPEGGTMNYRFSTYDDVSELANSISITKGCRRPKSNFFFRAESFFNVASKSEDYRNGDPKEIYYEMYGGKSLHEQSHGESFLSLFKAFSKDGIYIMDEPEAALSPQRQLTLLIQIVEMAKNGAQFIIATHSPILLGMPEADIWSFDEEKLHKCSYEDTKSYQITEMFINNREAMIKNLLMD